jgi:hypothetical protein
MSDEPVFEMKVSDGLKHYPESVMKALAFAAAGWHGALMKYPPQRGLRQNIATRKKTSDVAYKRTHHLGMKARGEKLTTVSVDLGGIYYTPCVLNVRRSPASLAGETIWPGKLDEAKLAASKAFNAEFKRKMKGHV